MDAVFCIIGIQLVPCCKAKIWFMLFRFEIFQSLRIVEMNANS